MKEPLLELSNTFMYHWQWLIVSLVPYSLNHLFVQLFSFKFFQYYSTGRHFMWNQIMRQEFIHTLYVVWGWTKRLIITKFKFYKLILNCKRSRLNTLCLKVLWFNNRVHMFQVMNMVVLTYIYIWDMRKKISYEKCCFNVLI